MINIRKNDPNPSIFLNPNWGNNKSQQQQKDKPLDRATTLTAASASVLGSRNDSAAGGDEVRRGNGIGLTETRV